MVNNNEIFQAEIDKALINFKNTNYKKSIEILNKLEKKKSHFIVYWYLGHSYFRINDYLSAIKSIKKSIKLKKPDQLNLNFLAEVFLRTNNYREAIKTFKKVLNIDKENINALFNLAKAYLDLGEMDTAKQYYKKVINKEPLNFQAWYELIRMDKKYLTKDLIEKIEKNSINKKNFDDIFSRLIIAEKYKLSKNYKKEINHLLKAHNNYLLKKEKAANQEFNYYTNLLPKFISKVKRTNIEIVSDLRPIFVMGLPRSGTTLIENIISSSNDNIDQGGEMGALSKVFFSEDLISDYESQHLNTNFMFKKNDYEHLNQLFLNQYNQLGIKTSKEFFTDKSIENLLYIDLIYKFFPKAKFIYCKRNKFANLLGILKVFMPNLLWCHSIERIIQMMNIYDNKIKEIINENIIKIHVIELENFSYDPLKNSKNLFNFLEIDWNDKILENSVNSKKIIQTVSNLQVREKIIKHDLNYLDSYLPILKGYGIDKLN
jgi:tetratricopeptide (TPR) repeat protein